MANKDLPEEILAAIFSYLRLSGDEDYEKDDKVNRRTLLNLCYVSKTFARLTSPERYRTISSTLLPPESSKKLLQTLLADEHLCVLVRHLKSTCLELYDLGYVKRFPEPSHESTVFGCLIEADFSCDALLKISRKYGRLDAATALLLRLCMRIESLTYRPSLHFRACIVASIISMTSSDIPAYEIQDAIQRDIQLPPFRFLRSIEYISEPNRRADLCEYMLASPALEVFKGSGLTLYWMQPGWGTATAVQTISLHEFCIDMPSFEWLLEMCPVLENLRINWCKATTEIAAVIDWRVMGDALRRLGTNLRKCELDTDYPGDPHSPTTFGNPRHVTGTRIGNLSSLHSLQHLALPCEAFWGYYSPTDLWTLKDDVAFQELIKEDRKILARTLPTSLKTLCVLNSNIEGCVMDFMEELICDHSFESLSLVRVE